MNLSIDEIYDDLDLSDQLIVKALNISEVGQIARIETKLRKYLEDQYDELKKKAIKEAVKMAKEGKTASQISKRVIYLINDWSKKVESRFRKDLKTIYEKSRHSSWKKVLTRTKAPLTYDMPVRKDEIPELPASAIILPKFDVEDTKMIEALEDDQFHWLQEHVDRNMSQTIRQVVRDTMAEAGKDRVEAGRLLQDKLTQELGMVRTPEGFTGTQRQYFEGIAANAAAHARVAGHLRSFEDLGVTKYQIVNPIDERTCPVCSIMDGKVFLVPQGVKTVQDTLEADNPEDIKEIRPWYSIKELEKITEGPGNQGPKDAKALADAGFALPPFHFRCRCTVTVSEEAGSFELD